MWEILGAIVFGLIGIAVLAVLVIILGMLFTGPTILSRAVKEEVHHHHHHGVDAPKTREEAEKFEREVLLEHATMTAEHRHIGAFDLGPDKPKKSKSKNGTHVVHYHHYHAFPAPDETEASPGDTGDPEA
jgi:hypothetical protein